MVLAKFRLIMLGFLNNQSPTETFGDGSTPSLPRGSPKWTFGVVSRSGESLATEITGMFITVSSDIIGFD